MNFNNDEMNLMCIYNTGNRKDLLKALSEMQKELAADEMELCELTDSAVSKLEDMTDDEYNELELYPDFNNED